MSDTAAEPSYRILLVEDDDDDAELLAWSLRRQPRPYSLNRVANLTDCLESFSRNDYDVILLDLGLPGIRRFEALETIVAQAGAPPVLMLTGLDDEGAQALALAAGASGYLVKANDTGRLFDAILLAIGAHRGESAGT